VPDDAPFLLDVTRLIWRRWKGRHPTGIDRVCLAYLRHFGGRAQAVVQHDRFRRILNREVSAELFDLLDAPAGRFRARLATGFLRHLTGFSRDGNGRLYLNVGHTGLDSPGLRSWVSRSGVRPIYLVHDLIPMTHPHFCRPGESRRHEERMRTVLRTGAGVIANSDATFGTLGEFARNERVPMPPALTAPLGSEVLRPKVRDEQSARPSFVILGTIEGRKNHLLLLDIWSRLLERLGANTPELLIIGQRGWEADAVFERLGRSDRLRGHVTELNHCSDDELALHLASARALLFPSHAEGYGLPALEALGSGVPVIASDLPAFRELCRDVPDYLASGDSAGWEAAILDYARSDSAARAAQLERMRSFEAPTWEAHFQRVERWLSDLEINNPAARRST
jgi:glycosyltransferase involved in cell wall biosynthesis